MARRLSCQISANQRGVETSANVNKHWKKRGYNSITKVISANQLCFPGNANLIQYHQSPIKEKGQERPRTNKPFGSSKNSHEATANTFLVKMSFNCMGLKNTHFHVNLARFFEKNTRHVQNRSSPSILYCVFLHHILEIKPK